MPNIKSAKKRVKVTATKTLLNQIKKSILKTSIKKFEAAVALGDKEKASEAFRIAVKKIDQAAAHNIIHKNTASNKKSKLAKFLNKIA